MDLSRPFCGATAVRAGLVTPNQLRGPRFRRLVRGVHVRAEVPVTYLLRCEAAALAVGALAVTGAPVPGGGSVALAGWAAAEVHDARCAPKDVPVEIVAPGGSRRIRGGVLVHRGLLAPDELVPGVRIPVPEGRRPRFVPGRTVTATTPLRTAFDLARRVPRVEAVIALDALARVGGFTPTSVLDLAGRRPGARGIRRLPGLVALSDPLAGSPMETRVRLALHDGGLPPPVLQHPVGPYRIDLSYPHVRLGIEYDGEHHRDPAQARKDLERQQYLSRAGWTILRPSAVDVLLYPESLALSVRAHLERREAVVPGTGSSRSA